MDLYQTAPLEADSLIRFIVFASLIELVLSAFEYMQQTCKELTFSKMEKNNSGISVNNFYFL